VSVTQVLVAQAAVKPACREPPGSHLGGPARRSEGSAGRFRSDPEWPLDGQGGVRASEHDHGQQLTQI
jgi:hypothetical protein